MRVTVGDCEVRIVETSRVVRGSCQWAAGRVVPGPGWTLRAWGVGPAAGAAGSGGLAAGERSSDVEPRDAAGVGRVNGAAPRSSEVELLGCRVAAVGGATGAPPRSSDVLDAEDGERVAGCPGGGLGSDRSNEFPDVCGRAGVVRGAAVGSDRSNELPADPAGAGCGRG